ncbi:Ppx/GppA family phosphatase [Marinicauda salina]|uniref:Ppx/GppA family phosphatase n=1 Tax=Marinicauda salina TaxID=2135793 RepID=A0A2U2BTJ2_9PROT|nr:Ppx/GppA family phosphatase [Marinicauda salina]PWE17327.1 Ppx/GppA family phosphatase [Marinicauda salina]
MTPVPASAPPESLAEAPARRDVAVIDIGSNSVRLVQFRIEGRALWPVFNEKTMAGLGRDARETGRLNPEGVESAMRALKRFARLLDAKHVGERHAVATAAVRDSEDGPDFVARAERETGLDIEVLSGEEEGRRSAIGVIGGVGDADGVAGDLGGSSLELTPLSGRRAGAAVSLPLGPLAVHGEGPGDPKAYKAAIDAGLERAAPVLDRAGPVFYAVGGAWRAFAHLAMALDDYPLILLHQYALRPEQVARAADFAATQSEASLASIPGVSSKRAPTLPYAALLLKRLIRHGGFERVVFSANGLREGVVYAADSSLVADGDPLLDAAEALVRNASPEPGFGPALAAWIARAFEAEPEVFGRARDALVRAAAARLTDIGARMHPDHRAELATTQTLYAPFGGVSHGERAFLALAMHHRYAGRKPREETCPSRRLLDDAGEEAAMRVGLALRLGAALSGRSAGLLEAFRLERTEAELVLRVEPGREELVVERALQRFEQFADAMGLTPRVI